MGITLTSLAFAAAVRMVNRVHGRASGLRFPAQPARFPGLAEDERVMVGIGYLPDRGAAVQPDQPYFA
jgi:hypothetical protein